MTNKQKVFLYLGREILRGYDVPEMARRAQLYRALQARLYPTSRTAITRCFTTCDNQSCPGCAGIDLLINRKILRGLARR